MKKERHGIVPQIFRNSKAFSGTFAALFILSVVFLASVDALPDPQVATADQVSHTDSQITVTTSAPEAPVRVVAKSISLDVKINNPTSTDIDVLDNSLLTGAAHYPTSAELGVDGTVLLFGHSSYLPIVHNQAYKTFDGIQNLKPGDIVSVYSGTHEYRYSVTGVKLADANQDVIELESTGKHLVLVTCDSFAQKSNRFVVSADFVGAYSLGN
jgi:LPXTG-site transpeptidase (sortase) family protein